MAQSICGGLHLKTIDRPKRVWLLGAAALAVAVALVGGCDDEPENPTDGGGTSSPIEIESIIASPKAGSPGDTLLISVIVTSSNPNEGDIPSVQWTATGGAFLEDDQSTVRWVAPTNGIYEITARATNDANSVTSTANLFVGESTTLVTDRGGAVRLQPNGSDLFYFRSAVNPALGAEVYSVVGIGAPTDAVVTPAGANGSNNHSIVYARDVSFEAHSVDSVNAAAENVAAHLYIGDLTTQAYRKISSAPPAGEVYPRFTDPDISPDSRYVAFGGMLPAFGAASDTFDVFVYDAQGLSRTNVTKTHTNHRNAFPTWSSDHRWLTFISDRTPNQWELYGLPVTGGVVNTSQASLVRLTNTGGSITDGTVATLVKPLMAWNPVSPILAVVGVDAFYLVQTTPAGASQIDVPITAPIELQWSPDGSLLAASIGGAVLTIETDGTGVTRVERAGDTFADLAWTPDGQWLLYRATRGSSSWLEAYDIDQSLLSAPIAITSAEPHSVGNRSLGEYRSVMSMSPAVGNSNVLFYPTFAGAGTVGVKRIDASALSP